jgi:hypothetical protein
MLLFALLLVLAALGLLVVALTTSAMFWAWFSVVASVAACVLLIADWWRRKHVPTPEPQAAEPVVAAEEPADSDPEAELDPEAEPAEEDTDAADVLIVTDLDIEVRVLDERPRYHLTDCRWVGDRASLPPPIKEARQLGFDPCAVCTPDAVIAERYRSSAE